MIQIRLTDEQTKAVAAALEPIQVCDARGNVLTTIAPVWTEEDIAEAKRRLASKDRRHSADQVHSRLNALEAEWDRTGGFDKEYMHTFLDRLRAEDAQ